MTIRDEFEKRIIEIDLYFEILRTIELDKPKLSAYNSNEDKQIEILFDNAKAATFGDHTLTWKHIELIFIYYFFLNFFFLIVLRDHTNNLYIFNELIYYLYIFLNVLNEYYNKNKNRNKNNTNNTHT